jgi:predicted DNA-binding ribbon-helix-helix protein
MKSPKRAKSSACHTVLVASHKTSVSLEPQFWEALKEIATERRSTLKHLVTSIDRDRREGNLSSAIRLYVLGYYQNQIAARTSA